MPWFLPVPPQGAHDGPGRLDEPRGGGGDGGGSGQGSGGRAARGCTWRSTWRPATASGPRAGLLHSRRCRWRWPSRPRHTPSRWPKTWNTARIPHVHRVCTACALCVDTARTHAACTPLAGRDGSALRRHVRGQRRRRGHRACRRVPAHRAVDASRPPPGSGWERQPGSDSLGAPQRLRQRKSRQPQPQPRACVPPRCRGQGPEAVPP